MSRSDTGAGIGALAIAEGSAAHQASNPQSAMASAHSSSSSMSPYRHWFTAKTFVELLIAGLNLAATILFYNSGVGAVAVAFGLAIAAAVIALALNIIEYRNTKKHINDYPCLKRECEANLQVLPAVNQDRNEAEIKLNKLGHMPKSSHWFTIGANIGLGLCTAAIASFNFVKALGASGTFQSPIPFLIFTVISILAGTINAYLIKNRIESKQSQLIEIDRKVKIALLAHQATVINDWQLRSSLLVTALQNRCNHGLSLQLEAALEREPRALAVLLEVPFPPASSNQIAENNRHAAVGEGVSLNRRAVSDVPTPAAAPLLRQRAHSAPAELHMPIEQSQLTAGDPPVNGEQRVVRRN